MGCIFYFLLAACTDFMEQCFKCIQQACNIFKAKNMHSIAYSGKIVQRE